MNFFDFSTNRFEIAFEKVFIQKIGLDCLESSYYSFCDVQEKLLLQFKVAPLCVFF